MTRKNTVVFALTALFTLVTLSLATADIHYTATYQPPYEYTPSALIGLDEGKSDVTDEPVQVDGYYRFTFGAATTGADREALNSWTTASFKAGLGMQAEMVTNHTFSNDNVLTIPVPYPDTMEDDPDYINPNYPKVRVPALYRYMHGTAWTDSLLARGKKSSYFKKETRRIADGLERRVGDLVLVIEGYGKCKHTARMIDGVARTFVKAPKPTFKLSVGSDGDSIEVDEHTWQPHADFPQGRIVMMNPPVETAMSPSLQRSVGTQTVTWGSLKARK